MSIAFIILIGVHCVLHVNTWLNALILRPKSTKHSPVRRDVSVSVLVPARNEEANLPRLIESFLNQSYQPSEMIIYDDQSEDRTWDLVQSAAGNRIAGIKGESLPAGWVGKVHACHKLAEASTSDVFLFLDADTEFLGPDALQNLIDTHTTRDPDTVITGMPGLRGGGLLIVTMIGHIILSTVPWWLKNRVPFASLSGLNGQCWMIDAPTYKRLTPHSMLRAEVLEDVMIGRYLHRNGVIPVLINAQDDLAVHMYPNFTSAWHGFRKNTSSILGRSTLRALLSWLVYVCVFVAAPLFFPFLLLSQILLKLITDRVLRQPIWVSILTPLSVVLAAVLSLDSILARATNQVTWKGRRVLMNDVFPAQKLNDGMDGERTNPVSNARLDR